MYGDSNRVTGTQPAKWTQMMPLTTATATNGSIPHQQRQPQNPPVRQLADSGPRAKCDQVIFEAVAKALEIVVGGRCSDPQDRNDCNNRSSLTSGSGGGSNSTRFNLHVPELPAVRAILQSYRRALHVPLRLDVYYQHNSSEGVCRRELLERWCLEYNISSNSGVYSFGNEAATTLQQQDPIVQLRQVCKRIVLWLRTMYCWTRLLPAQAFRSNSQQKHNNSHENCRFIGFSIYVEKEGKDDVTDLVQNQGFQLHGQKPSCSVATPYGELNWKVVYAPHAALQHLLLQQQQSQQSLKMQIPISIQEQQQQQQHMSTTNHRSIPMEHQQTYSGRSTPQAVRKTLALPKSDPVKKSVMMVTQQQQLLLPPLKAAAGSYNKSNVSPRSFASVQQQPNVIREHSGNGYSLLQRRNTFNGTGEMEQVEHGHHQQRNHSMVPSAADGKKVTPSGLSLALMMSDENNHHENQNGNSSNNNEQNIAVGAPGIDSVVTEKRRVALHQLPPLLAEQQLQESGSLQALQGEGSTAGHNRASSTVAGGQGVNEYGYAYNSHIPWQKIHPSTTAPSVPMDNNDNYMDCVDKNNQNSPSPSSIATDLSSKAVAVAASAGTTTTLGASPAGAAFVQPPTGTTPSKSSLLTTMDRNPTVAPPFATRPLGFVAHSGSQAMPAASAVAGSSATAGIRALGNQQPNDLSNNRVNRPRTTSLDLLHSSPFQQPPPGALSSMVSSLSMMGGVGDTGVPFLDSALAIGSTAGDKHSHYVASSSLGFGSAFPPSASLRYEHHHDRDDQNPDFEEEMPFAVDNEGLLTSVGTTNLTKSSSPSMKEGVVSASSDLGASAAVASFAHKCDASTHRLKLFESQINKQQEKAATCSSEDGGNNGQSGVNQVWDGAESALADQLAELRAFGEALGHDRAPYSRSEGGDSNNGNDHRRQHSTVATAAAGAGAVSSGEPTTNTSALPTSLQT